MDYRITSEALDKTKILGIVSVADVKRSERVSHSREDDFIEEKIVAAYDWIDGMGPPLQGYFMLEREFELFVPSLVNTLEIPIRPLQEESLKIFARAADGSYAEINAADFTVAKQDDCAVLASFTRAAFPFVRSPHPRAYRITFKAGQARAQDVPAALRQGIILLASHYYANREATVQDPRLSLISREIEFGIRRLAGKYAFHLDHS